MKTLRLTIFACGWLLGGLAPAAEIQLRTAASPAGTVVVLGDVAEIFASDATLVGTLQQIELFPAPPLGVKRFVRMREIQDLLEIKGINLAEHSFTGASPITVLREESSQPIIRASRSHSPADVRRAQQMVQDAISQHLEAGAGKKETWIVELDLDDDTIRLLLAAGRIESLSGGAAPWTGAQEFAVTLSGNPAKTCRVKAAIRLAPAVVVAIHPVARGAVIQATDVQLDRSQPINPKAEVATSLEEVVGKEASQAIVAGRPIDRGAVRQPVLVHRGEVVTVYVRSPGVQIRTAARSKDNGAQGELIAVESLESRQSYFARVTGIQTAEVYARAQSAE